MLKLRSFFLLAITLVMVGMSPLISSATSPQGYATYNATVVHNSSTQTFTVNESVYSTGQRGLSTITIQVISKEKNLTYSTDVNSSLTLFPYLPTLRDQSLTYQSRNLDVRLSLTKDGTGSVSFNGKSYQTTNYSLAVTLNSTSGAEFSANGELATMPSGLIYSLFLRFDQSSSVQFQLVATNLPLDPIGASSPSSSGLTAVVLVGIGVAAVAAVAVPWKIIRGRKASNNLGGEGKPPHWVD